MKLAQTPLVFIDTETTGEYGGEQRVIEVGAVRVENHQVVDKFETLLDPLGYVPGITTRLTGITYNDVDGAPQFAQVADGLRDFLDGAVFVAHNVAFDYGVLRREFERTHDTFAPPLLCTVKLSRKLFRQYPRHDLESIITRHALEVPARHRALADAEAIWQFYQLCLQEFDLDTVEAAVAAQLKPRRPRA